MKRVLVAGATGYLGGFVAREFKARGYFVRALARSPEKLAPLRDWLDEIVKAEVTRPETLTHVCDGVDVVFSSIGITKQKDGLTFRDEEDEESRPFAGQTARSINVSGDIREAALMKTLEIIHLRLAGDSTQTLVDAIRKSVGSEPDPMEVRIYRHGKLETDLAVHLHRDVAMRNDRASDVGIHLASLLREYGMVEHSVWVEACDVTDRSTSFE